MYKTNYVLLQLPNDVNYTAATIINKICKFFKNLYK